MCNGCSLTASPVRGAWVAPIGGDPDPDPVRVLTSGTRGKNVDDAAAGKSLAPGTPTEDKRRTGTLADGVSDRSRSSCMIDRFRPRTTADGGRVNQSPLGAEPGTDDTAAPAEVSCTGSDDDRTRLVKGGPCTSSDCTAIDGPRGVADATAKPGDDDMTEVEMDSAPTGTVALVCSAGSGIL